jgi:hypothetical protein
MTMSDLAQNPYVQIVYVSRSTFTTMPPERGIEPSVARILAQSRTNNAKRGLVGALYFGDGCFFQCLEGRAEDVDRLYATLLKDPRHTDLKVLSRRNIPVKNFSNWAMKYVPLDAEMKTLMRELGMPSFDPYRFDDAIVARVLQMLARGSDVASVSSHEGPAAASGGKAHALRIAVAVGVLAAAAIAGAMLLDLI